MARPRGSGKGTPETLAALGRWLRERREAAEQTQEQVAQALGTDRRKIIRWEQGESEPEGLALLAYLDAVGVKIVPSAPDELPAALNAEVRLLRAEVAALRALMLESVPKSRRGTEAYYREFQKLLRQRNALMGEEESVADEEERKSA